MAVGAVNAQQVTVSRPREATTIPPQASPAPRPASGDTLSLSKASQGLSDRMWGTVNHAAAGPVQFMFRHMNNVKPSDSDKLGRFGKPELAQILEHAQPGDLILWGDATSFVHASLYIGDGQIIHSLAARAPEGQKNGVVQETVEDYLQRVDRERVVIVRPKQADAAQVQSEITFAKAQIGKDYDYLFRTGKTDAYYCSELAYAASTQGPHPARITPHKAGYGLKSLVTNDDIRRSPDFEEIWNKNAPPIGKARTVGLS